MGEILEKIREQIQKTMIGNFRAALNKTTPLQAIGMVESAEIDGVVALTDVTGKPIPSMPEALISYSADTDLTDGKATKAVTQEVTVEGERAVFRSVLLDDCQVDLSPFGIEVVSVSMQRIPSGFPCFLPQGVRDNVPCGEFPRQFVAGEGLSFGFR